MRSGKRKRPGPRSIRLDPALILTGRLAEEAGLAAYLVGGAVRDLLLGRKTLDLDVAVEGDPAPLVRKLARRLKGKVTCHERFGTFVLELKGGRHIDFATARGETYSRPAALPDVRPGTLREDLFRRDFTMNALALVLGGPLRGKVVDLYGGLHDLASRTLVVLHAESFKDDPTRIFRLARFAGRGFRPGRETEKLARRDKSYVKRLSAERVREEILAILSEKDPRPALKLLAKWGILRSILPEATPKKLSALTGSASLEDRLAVLFSGLDKRSLERRMEELKFPRKLKSGIALKLYPPPAPAMLNGDDLIRMGYAPGPLFKKILEAVASRRFASRKAAARFVFDKFPDKI